MKKIFISQPMRGKSNDEIKFERLKAIEWIKGYFKDEEVEIIDSFFENAPVDMKPLWYLSKSLELLSEADAAYFVDGWNSARGCNVEHVCAATYGIEIIHE